MFTPVWHSIFVAIVSTIIAFFAMLPLSYYFAGRKSKIQLPVETIILLPLVLPPTVVGLILLSLFGKNNPLAALYGTNSILVLFFHLQEPLLLL
ncbi:molybdate ABC transporter permease protein [Listeria fleischmannii subsp. coloradonensis]|nr:molybdate ABC transporter permease protein [Listeria fleischmannii subsp. coloradonensis]